MKVIKKISSRSPAARATAASSTASFSVNDRYTQDISNPEPDTPGTSLTRMSSRDDRDCVVRASMSHDSNFDDPNILDLQSIGSLDALCDRRASVLNLGLSLDALEEGALNTPPEVQIKTLGDAEKSSDVAIKATLESQKYDADTIRKEFRRYQKVLPSPDELLQERHSFSLLRKIIEEQGIELPRFLQYNFEGGIKPHHALCCLLLSEFQHAAEAGKAGWNLNFPSWVNVLSCGKLHSQINDPAEFIRDQFYRVAHAIPVDVVPADVLRKKIRNRGLPVPNYFLDPEDDNAIPPHIALLVILQENEIESWKFGHIVYYWAFSMLSFVALLLRIVLEVIGGAGAIWGGAEVFTLRTAENATLWRWISVAVGVMCFLRFITLNAPQLEDEGDILGPAGPWSLRFAVRLRAVTNHPFHYFMRAWPPSSPNKTM